MSLPLFLIGSRTLRTPAEHRTAVLNLCLQCGASYTDPHHDGEGNLCFRMALPAAQRLQRLCAHRDIPLTAVASHGIPPFLWRLRRRAGLLAGAVCAVLLMLLSVRFVWDVRVTGNEHLTRSEVLEELSACGFGVGSYIPDVRTEVLENHVLMRSDRLSWISVYLDGTVARVQVIEADPPDEKTKTPLPPANLVAAEDGQIEYLELYRGNCLVKPGQAVRRGELLVSGLYDSAVSPYRFTRAAGKVFARTKRTFRVEIPYAYEEKVYGTPETDAVVLKFFNFSLEIFKSTGNHDTGCDIIETETDAERFGLASLPVAWSVAKAYPYTLTPATRTGEEALELAYAELERRLAVFSEDAQLLGKQISTVITESAVVLECTVRCIENIAVQAEFEITESP